MPHICMMSPDSARFGLTCVFFCTASSCLLSAAGAAFLVSVGGVGAAGFLSWLQAAADASNRVYSEVFMASSVVDASNIMFGRVGCACGCVRLKIRGPGYQ